MCWLSLGMDIVIGSITIFYFVETSLSKEYGGQLCVLYSIWDWKYSNAYYENKSSCSDFRKAFLLRHFRNRKYIPCVVIT